MNFKVGSNDWSKRECIGRYARYVEDYLTTGYSAIKTAQRFGVSVHTVLAAITKYFKREEHNIVLKSKIWDAEEVEQY